MITNPVTVLWHQPYPYGIGADRWITGAWKQGFEALGHRFELLTGEHDLAERLRKLKPNIFITRQYIDEILIPANQDLLRAARDQGTRVMLWVAWPVDPAADQRWVDLLLKEDIADYYFGENELEQMVQFERDTGKRYHVVANAANPLHHYPGVATARYDYDVVYLGANLPKKSWLASNLVPALRERWRVGLFGPGWSKFSYVLWGASKGLRRCGLPHHAAWVDRRRITIPEAEERDLYASAKICLNFHEREPDGSQPHYIVNQRTFKIPACGGFQICDEVPAIRRYFARDELVMVPLDRTEWLNTIQYYVEHGAQRMEIQRKGTAKALAEHVSTNRAQQMLDLAGLGNFAPASAFGA